MAKTLVTHINPHLDDITAIWLFKRFNPDFKDAQVEFMSASDGNKGVEETEDRLFLGVGRGRFDEHKGDLDDAATSLVWKYLDSKGMGPKDPQALSAVKELVDWVRLDDLGKPRSSYDEFSLPAFIRPKYSDNASSLKAVDLGMEILDRILDVLKRKHQALIEWEKKVEFDSKFGKAYAIEGSAIDREFCKRVGGDLFLMVDPRNHSVQYFTPSFEIDLEPIYNKVKELDPEADWFLHQSHHMVICGSGSAPDSKKTKLSFEELMEAGK